MTVLPKLMDVVKDVTWTLTVLTPPPSVTWLTTGASVWRTQTARPGRSVTMASVSPMSVWRTVTVLILMPSAMRTMTTASGVGEQTVKTPQETSCPYLKDAAQAVLLTPTVPTPDLCAHQITCAAVRIMRTVSPRITATPRPTAASPPA